jgi:hypothetical protein
MAYGGVRWTALRESLALFCAYWGFFLICLLVALYCAILDWRYIHVQYTIARRELFRETLGDEAFRRALNEAERKAREGEEVKRGGNRMN